ncbi:MAG: N-acetylmuramic acid 6-phosphate etherase [Chitinophagales bacterium]|nr:N-acetylmuramic acid 6-phosphate etherase [Chitinophagales bacterium]
MWRKETLLRSFISSATFAAMKTVQTKSTEEVSKYNQLETMTALDLLSNINREDKSVAGAVEQAIPQIEKLVIVTAEKMKAGGRLFYIGSGTSGRLGIVDASECPPTFGIEQGLVNGIIAGGDAAIRKAQEFAEDDLEQGWKDLTAQNISSNDVVIGITASGSTPYVIGAIKKCNENNITTGCITCNQATELAAIATYPIEVIVGPEFVTGSTRMKAGTAQKLVLNMISTSAMILMGRIHDNKMVDMQLTNEKLIDRGAKMLMKYFAWDYKRARYILLEFGSVRKVLEAHKKIPKQ